jgi:hypothetical protein
VEENRPPRDLAAEDANIPEGDDDEAHNDVPAGRRGGTPVSHRVDPPEVNLGTGGHYGYDEAPDFGASNNQN